MKKIEEEKENACLCLIKYNFFKKIYIAKKKHTQSIYIESYHINKLSFFFFNSINLFIYL